MNDLDTLRMALKTALEQHGYEVECPHDEALQVDTRHQDDEFLAHENAEHIQEIADAVFGVAPRPKASPVSSQPGIISVRFRCSDAEA